MGRFINTEGNPTLGVAICARCCRKFPIGELHADPNYPGLRVCSDDMDVFDPYRLPARQPEDVTLAFTRPEVPIGTNPAGTITEDGDYFIIAEDEDDYLEP